jgi:hypothetical protein
MSSNPDLYIHIVPLKNSDHKRVSRSKNNPLQRIKVSDNTTLHTIASYVKRIAGAESDNTYVTLYTTYHNEPLQVPLSLSVLQYILLTSQGEQCEVRYAFTERPMDAPVAAPTFQPSFAPRQEAHARYPPPSLGRFETFTPGLVHPIDSFGAVFHSGFSLFSNSFGGFPMSLDPATVHQPAEAKGEDAISLRKNLEMEIQRK